MPGLTADRRNMLSGGYWDHRAGGDFAPFGTGQRQSRISGMSTPCSLM
jgi:hypothetical protein